MNRLTIRNRSDYPDEEVRRLVRYALADLDMRGTCVNVKNARTCAFRGMAYHGVPFVSDAPAKAAYLVTIGIGAESRFPRVVREGGSRFPAYTLNDWREALVNVAAHEGRHIEQYKNDEGRSELVCEHFAVAVLRRYRAEAAA